MGGWWLHDVYQNQGAAGVVSWAFWVIFSIVLHELAHGWAALWQGDDTPRRLHRMTWNPLVHMGPMSLMMFALIGIAWGLMPTDPSKYRWKRRGRIVVAGAGPAMNIVLFLLAGFALALWTRYGSQADPLGPNMTYFLRVGAFLNLALAGLNLLPIPPLDGSGILSGISFRWHQWMQNPQFVMAGFFIVLAVFISGVGVWLFLGAREATRAYTQFVVDLLPG